MEPDWSITQIERLDGVAAESSDPWNNAGTGHSALCELNYTPENKDGSVDISKAVTVNEQFQVSRQFWAHAAANGLLGDGADFINPVPHVSFVHGAERVDYLRRRYEALACNPLFARHGVHRRRRRVRPPAAADGRQAATSPIRSPLNSTQDGTDVDFGALTKQLVDYGVRTGNVALLRPRGPQPEPESDGSWTLKVRNRRTGDARKINAKFVFVGAGGGALPLLQKSGINEAKGFGGFPVGGEFLRTSNPEVVARHRAKVYGKAAVGAPPMSAPHLDARIIDGKSWLMFGPFAGMVAEVPEAGPLTDLPLSVKPHNLLSMLGVGVTQMSLVNYLVSQLLPSRRRPCRRAAGIRPRGSRIPTGR